MKIQLVVPPQELGISYTDRCYWSQGPLRLATYLKREIPDVDMSLVDGPIELESWSTAELEKKIDGDSQIVGVSVSSTYSYQNALKVAKIAKDNGVGTVILGGHHINDIEIAKASLQNHNFLDAICYGKGERTLAAIAQGRDLEDTPGIVFLKNSEARITPKDPNPFTINDFQILDHNLLDLEKYKGVQEERLWYSQTPQAVTFTHEGCWWREKTGGCTFCMIPGKALVIRDPKSFWKEIGFLKEQYGFQAAKDYGDDFTGLDKAKREAQRKGFILPGLEDFLDTRPEELSDFTLLGYGKTDEINEKVGGLLRKLNFGHLLVGYESGSDRQLKNMVKGTTRRQHIKATKILAKNNIMIYAGFVLGTPGEDLESLEETLSLAKELVGFGNMTTGGASPISIFPGSPDWLRLIYAEPKYASWDDFPIDEARMDWIRLFCPDLGDPIKALDILTKYSERINGLFPEENRLGWEHGE